MKFFHCMASMLAIALSGCGVELQPKESEPPRDFGQPITKADAEEKAAKFFEKNLKDPFSAHIQYPQDPYGWCFTDGLMLGGQRHCGYAFSAIVNAKNGFGGYTGATKYQMLFQGGAIRLVIEHYHEGNDTVVFRDF